MTRSEIRIHNVHGVRVVVPADRRLMTPYVLEEQEDWFEDEIRFMRTLIEPETVFIDVGANYGLYALSVAGLAPGGQVWAYEPGAATAAHLRESIAENHFDHVTVIQRALSDREGAGSLRTGRSPELNALVDAPGQEEGQKGQTLLQDQGDIETVELTTLDTEQRAHGWGRIDLVKVDAEGHEARVVEGGRELFLAKSPLVMCEVKAGASFDLEAPRRLIDFGYRTYRLVPGLQALAPHDLNEALEPSQLNIFCCKPDRGGELQRRGKLVLDPPAADPARAAPGLWRDYLGAFAYGRTGLDGWITRTGEAPLDGWNEYRNALDLYALAMDPGRDIGARYAALRASHAVLAELLRTRANPPRMASFARVAADLGARGQAVRVLEFLLDTLDRSSIVEFLREPLLSPSPEFDTVEPTGTLDQWALAAAMEAFERLRTFSSYFSDPKLTLAMTDALKKVGYLTPQMSRRADLARQRLSIT